MWQVLAWCTTMVNRMDAFGIFCVGYMFVNILAPFSGDTTKNRCNWIEFDLIKLVDYHGIQCVWCVWHIPYDVNVGVSNPTLENVPSHCMFVSTRTANRYRAIIIINRSMIFMNLHYVIRQPLYCGKMSFASSIYRTIPHAVRNSTIYTEQVCVCVLVVSHINVVAQSEISHNND